MIQRARSTLDEILDTEEFKPVKPTPPLEEKLVKRFFDHLPEGAWIRTALEWLLYFFLGIAILLIAISIAGRLRKMPSFVSTRESPANFQSRVSPQAMESKAYEYFRTGDHRQAIRHLYLSILLYLDGAGLLTYEQGKTDGEYIAEAQSNMSDKAGSFASLTLLFEREWYGMEESGERDFKQCEDIFVRLVEQSSSANLVST